MMDERALDAETQAMDDRPGATASRTALNVTLAILAVMGVALAIDASSEPSLVVLVVLLIGGLIAALAVWG